MGWVEEAETSWSENGVKKTIPNLEKRLINIIKVTKNKTPLDKPPPCVPQRKKAGVLGTATNQLKQLVAKHEATADKFELIARKEWRGRNERGKGSVHETCQMIGKRKLGVSFKKSLIEVLVSFDVEDENGRPTGKKVMHWCGGVVEKISDGTWLLPIARKKC